MDLVLNDQVQGAIGARSELDLGLLVSERVYNIVKWNSYTEDFWIEY